jgi:predicted transcriptional regulator
LIISQHQSSYPVNVSGIAKDLGINVFVDPNLPANVSGVLRKDKHGGTSGYLILVKADHTHARQRFTVAHELGHFVLHRREVNGEIRDDEFYRALPGPLERQANEFAADILMPWHLVNKLQDDGVTQLDEMAKHLGVSKQALAIRLGLPYDQDWT